jgi:beta-barrel assembly-enhancing protease
MKLRTTMLAAGTLALTMGAPAAHAQFKPSKNDQIRLGREAAAEVRRRERVLSTSDERVRLMKEVGNRLLAAMDRNKDPWQYSFDVIDNKQVNAFAFPGGPIFFYTGLLDRIKTEDQLAGVLAHEITHVKNEHWASAYNDNQKRKLGLTVILMILRANRSAFDIAGALDTLLVGLPYSRKHETEADDRGFDLMIKAGYNPEGIVDVFRILAAAGGGKGPEWLSTHPNDKNRVRRLQDKVNKLNQQFSPQRRVPWAVD